MMKYVFLLTLLVFGAVSGVLGMKPGTRWTHHISQTQRVAPPEQAFPLPSAGPFGFRKPRKTRSQPLSVK